MQGVAALLIAAGALLLLDRFGWLSGVGSWLWGLLFLAGGAAFLAVAWRDRERWWALIPGFALVGLAAAVLMGAAGGPLFLALLGVAFAVVYATDHRRWWAIIPAGALATLALVAYLGVAFPRYEAGWVFFVGLAATFLALVVQPPERRQRWAVIPAIALAALALVTVMAQQAGTWIVALLLIAGGGVLLLRRPPDERRLPRRGGGPTGA